MSDFLAEVAAEQRERAAALRALRPELARRSAARRSPPRDLGAALRAAAAGGRLAVIAEVKRRSPTAGDLARIPDPATLALHYAVGGAAAISVLTEERHFHGALADLARVRESVKLPVLRKDFLVDELQLLEAHAYGADAVLLIAELFDDAGLARMLRAAAELGLSALVEAHEPAAFARAVASGADVVGVNRRDLRALTLDPDRAARLAPLVPDGRLLVAESGIASARDAAALPARVDAVLVGAALVAADAPHALVAELARARIAVDA